MIPSSKTRPPQGRRRPPGVPRGPGRTMFAKNPHVAARGAPWCLDQKWEGARRGGGRGRAGDGNGIPEFQDGSFPHLWARMGLTTGTWATRRFSQGYGTRAMGFASRRRSSRGFISSMVSRFLVDFEEVGEGRLPFLHRQFGISPVGYDDREGFRTLLSPWGSSRRCSPTISSTSRQFSAPPPHESPLWVPSEGLCNLTIPSHENEVALIVGIIQNSVGLHQLAE